MSAMHRENGRDKSGETWKLQTELCRTENIEEFMEENGEKFGTKTVSEYLNELLTQYNLDKADIAKRGGFAGNYPYQIFNGKKKASRDKLIQLAIGFPLSLEETQQLLQLGDYSGLYVKNKRDAYIMFAIEKKYDLLQINALLYSHDERTLE